MDQHSDERDTRILWIYIDSLKQPFLNILWENPFVLWVMWSDWRAENVRFWSWLWFILITEHELGAEQKEQLTTLIRKHYITINNESAKPHEYDLEFQTVWSNLTTYKSSRWEMYFPTRYLDFYPISEEWITKEFTDKKYNESLRDQVQKWAKRKDKIKSASSIITKWWIWRMFWNNVVHYNIQNWYLNYNRLDDDTEIWVKFGPLRYTQYSIMWMYQKIVWNGWEVNILGMNTRKKLDNINEYIQSQASFNLSAKKYLDTHIQKVSEWYMMMLQIHLLSQRKYTIKWRPEDWVKVFLEDIGITSQEFITTMKEIKEWIQFINNQVINVTRN